VSTLYVDEIAGIVSADTVAIPGHVIQVVNTQQNNSGWISTSSSTYVDSGISLNITPSATNSVIELDFRTYMAHGDRMTMTIYRDSTILASNVYAFGFHAETAAYESATILWRDEPATTSQITYKIYFRSDTGNTAHLVHNSSGYTFKAMEIAG